PVRFWQWSIEHGDGDIYVYPVITSPFQTRTFFRAIASVCLNLNVWLMLSASCLVVVAAVKAACGRVHELGAPLVLVTLLFLYATALHTLLTPDPRYATPYRPFAILLALSFVALLHELWRDRNTVNRPTTGDGLESK